jgi:uncharacterized membrane protein YfcA
MDMALILFGGAWFLAGFVNGISGMGAGMVALPLVVSCIPPAALVPSACIIIFAVTLHMAWRYRKACRVHSLTKLLLGCAPGAVAGVWVLLLLPPARLQLPIGLAMTSFALWQWLHTAGKAHAETWLSGGLAGFASGFINTSISFGNPPIAIYALYAGWSKEETMGTLNMLAVGTSALTCLAHAGAGLYTSTVWEYVCYGVPLALAGQWLAQPFVPYINPTLFKNILLGIIACAGIVCMGRAL